MIDIMYSLAQDHKEKSDCSHVTRSESSIEMSVPAQCSIANFQTGLNARLNT